MVEKQKDKEGLLPARVLLCEKEAWMAFKVVNP
jgi:hypothetical protein